MKQKIQNVKELKNENDKSRLFPFSRPVIARDKVPKQSHEKGIIKDLHTNSPPFMGEIR